MKKPLLIATLLSSLSLFLVWWILQNYLLFSRLEKDLKQYLTQTLSGEVTDKELPEKIITNLEKINQKFEKINSKKIEPIKSATADLLLLSKKFIREDRSYIVLLQNSDELRATGGFMGSFFVLESQGGQIQAPIIQDIYAVDGQFQGFVEAPTGLKEYLSAGKGMRLPDANWWPDFPSSAEEILGFFAKVEDKKYEGVISINLQLVEKLLAITGNIYLPDYQQYVNQDNFAKIARADRDNFFPGSQEKANFLNHFFKIFKLELSQKIKENPQAFLDLIEEMISNKDLQAYSLDQEIQELIKRRKIDQTMQSDQKTLYYFPVESNVGINKANRLVGRQLEIKIEENGEELSLNFHNNNPFPYINYQRLYTNPQTTLQEIKIDGQKIEKIDQRIMQTSNGQSFLEIGFLVAVLENSSSQVEINLNSQLKKEDKREIFVAKQAGLRSSGLTVNGREIQFTGDQLINLD